MSKKIKLFIILSIVLNLLFIGVFIGNNIRHYSVKHYGMKSYGMKRGDQIIQLVDNSSIAKPQKKIFIEQLNEALPMRKNRSQKMAFRRFFIINNDSLSINFPYHLRKSTFFWDLTFWGSPNLTYNFFDNLYTNFWRNIIFS